jgi:hypothetical protein
MAPKAAKLAQRFGLNTRGQDPEKVVRALEGLDDALAEIKALEAEEEQS